MCFTCAKYFDQFELIRSYYRKRFLKFENKYSGKQQLYSNQFKIDEETAEGLLI